MTFIPGVPKATGSAIGKTNIISPNAVVTGDLRFLTEQQKINARKTMQNIVNQSLTGTKATITFQDGIPSMAPTPGNEQVMEVISGVTKSMGMGPTVAGDPGSRGAHAPGETINLKEFPILIKRAALTIYRLTR